RRARVRPRQPCRLVLMPRPRRAQLRRQARYPRGPRPSERAARRADALEVRVAPPCARGLAARSFVARCGLRRTATPRTVDVATEARRALACSDAALDERRARARRQSSAGDARRN